MNDKRELGKVDEAVIQKEDHGILTFMIGIDFGGTHQGFGTYALDTWDEKKGRRVGTAAGCDMILKILNLFNVEKFEDIIGKPVYALRDDDSWGSMITGLETPPFDGGKKLLIEDWKNEWFPEEVVKSAR